MKTPSNDLFLLIQALSPNEKKYFKKFASRHITSTKTNYLLLFNAIDKQKEYNEEELKKIFRHKAFINQLSVVKNYLYHLILKSLMENDTEEHFVSIGIRNNLNFIEILINKGLYLQANKILQQLKQKINELELFDISLQIPPLEIRIQEVINPKYFSEYLPTYNHYISQNLSKINTLKEYTKLSISLYALLHLKQSYKNTADFKFDLIQLTNNEFFNNISKANSNVAKDAFHNVRALYFYLIEDFEENHKELKKSLKIWQNQPAWQKEKLPVFQSVIFNYMESCGILKKYTEALAVLEHLKKVYVVLEDDDHIKKNERLLPIEGEFLFLNKDYKTLINLVTTQIIPFFNQYKQKLTNKGKCDLIMLITKAYIVCNNYQNALQWAIEIVLNNPIIEIQEFYTLSRIYFIICHYELKNYSLAEYELYNFKRYLDKLKKPAHTIEQTFIKHLKKIIDAQQENKPKQKLTLNWQNFNAELNNNSNKNNTLYAVLFLWAQSALQKQT